MNSLGMMGFFHEELFDQITNWYVGQIKDEGLKLTEKDLLAYLITTATVNYCPKNSDILYEVRMYVLTYDIVCIEKIREREKYIAVSGKQGWSTHSGPNNFKKSRQKNS